MINKLRKGRVLIIAGSDSGGGAGIQGDIKTVTALGGYAATAITALTAQNTQGVFGIHDVPPEFVAQQIKVVLEDIGADAIKTGMLHNRAIIEAVVEALASYPDIPVIVDPVMVAKGGAQLLKPEGLAALKEKLIPKARVLTPNLPEAALLLEQNAPETEEEMRQAAEKLLSLGVPAVFLKGGHLSGDHLVDLLFERGEGARPSRMVRLQSQRISTPHTHGTGCALASAIATGLAQGMELEDACMRAHAYVHRAILGAPGLGQGHGPLGHLV